MTTQHERPSTLASRGRPAAWTAEAVYGARVATRKPIDIGASMVLQTDYVDALVGSGPNGDPMRS